MAALTANRAFCFVGSPDEINEKLVAEAAFNVGSTLVEATVTDRQVKKLVTQTANFMGLALDEATAAGDVVGVRRRGILEIALEETVVIADLNATIYADATNSSDNPADWTLSTLTNMAVGKIVNVVKAGASLANVVQIYFEADAYRSI